MEPVFQENENIRLNIFLHPHLFVCSAEMGEGDPVYIPLNYNLHCERVDIHSVVLSLSLTRTHIEAHRHTHTHIFSINYRRCWAERHKQKQNLSLYENHGLLLLS